MTTLAVIFAKILTFILKILGQGSGTALPGLIIGRMYPSILTQLVSQIPNIIIVTGTNGKTTTQTILRSILESADARILTNKAGANLSRGILSQLLKSATITGRLNYDIAIFEVEEATFPKIAKELNPNMIAITNLYRDQLDAYGEVDATEAHLRNGLRMCPNAKVILNGDDPRTSRLTENLPNPTYYTSLPRNLIKGLPYEGEIIDAHTYQHNITWSTRIKTNPDLTTEFDMQSEIDDKKLILENIKIAVPGFFHVYNALTAVTIAKLINVNDQNIKTGLQKFEPAFGRGEVISYTDGAKTINFRLLLIKNPAGFSLNLNILKNIKSLKLILAINDNIADGKDVSWLWDSKIELLNQAKFDWIITSGSRALDMHLRLKYALDGMDKTAQKITSEQDLKSAIAQAVENTQDSDTVFVLPTYTAMLELRKLMGKKLE